MTRRHTIDWPQAYTYYVHLGPTRSFVRVAEKFGVSDTAVRNRARLDGWEEKVRAIDARALEKAELTITHDRAKAIADTLRLVDLARSELLKRLKAGEAEVRLSDLPALVKLEQLLVGEPTDRIELAQVREFVVGFVGMVDEALARVVVAVIGDNGESRRLLTEFRKEIPALLEQAAAVEPTS
jgi:hypothetical protein